jgi:hypothetical protein
MDADAAETETQKSGATSSLDRVSPEAKQADASVEPGVGAPSLSASVAPPPIVSFAEALRNRRQAIAEKQAVAKELQALIDVGGQGVVSVGSAAKKICKEAQPEEDDEDEDDAGLWEEPAPEDEGEVVDYSEAEAEPDEVEAGQAEPAEWFVPELPRVVLSKSNSYRTAEVFGQRQVWQNRASEERVRGMHYWCGEFWEWRERSFRPVSKDAVQRWRRMFGSPVIRSGGGSRKSGSGTPRPARCCSRWSRITSGRGVEIMGNESWSVGCGRARCCPGG